VGLPLESVKSINVSGHKFGLVYPGVGWLVFRDDQQLPEELVFYEDYLGERDATFTLNFSGSSALILAQYYNFIRFGHSGYASLVRAMDANAESLATRLGAEDALELLGAAPRLPLVISRVREGEPFTGTDLVGELADALADDVHDSISDLRKRAAGKPTRKRVHRGHGY
jgi:glutamate decarboxylase